MLSPEELKEVLPAETSAFPSPPTWRTRAQGLKNQFIMDIHTHFLRDDTTAL